jgi:hypothetical protein
MAQSQVIHFTVKPVPKRWSLPSFVMLVNVLLISAITVPFIHDPLEGGYTTLQAVDRVLGWVTPSPVPSLTQEQNANADAIIKAGTDLGMNERDIQIGIMTAQQESGLRNLSFSTCFLLLKSVMIGGLLKRGGV